VLVSSTGHHDRDRAPTDGTGRPGVTGSISHESIYRGIYAHGTRGLRRGLHERLHRRRRCRKHRSKGGQPVEKKSPLGQFSPIATRPPIALERTEVGHLEGDLITGAYNRSAIVTVFDRTSRHVWLAEFPDDHGAEATLAALCEILGRIPEPLRRTLTWDQGREMARHQELAELCGIDIYFCDPHSPWQRPTNENGNGLLRRYVGKGTANAEINFRTVATAGGVSTDLLYRNAELRSRIEHLRSRQCVIPHSASNTLEAVAGADTNVVATLTAKLRQARSETADLKAQLTVAHGQLLALRRQLPGTAID